MLVNSQKIVAFLNSLLIAIVLIFFNFSASAFEIDGVRFTPEEVAKLKVAALNGDGRSASLLHAFYGVFVVDFRSSMVWLMVGAENGDVNSQVELASLLLNHREESVAKYLYPYAYAGGFRDTRKNGKKGGAEDDGELARLRAVYWLKLAAAKGDDRAKKMLESVSH